jgi:hypothetical protein
VGGKRPPAAHAMIGVIYFHTKCCPAPFESYVSKQIFNELDLLLQPKLFQSVPCPGTICSRAPLMRISFFIAFFAARKEETHQQFE